MYTTVYATITRYPYGELGLYFQIATQLNWVIYYGNITPRISYTLS